MNKLIFILLFLSMGAIQNDNFIIAFLFIITCFLLTLKPKQQNDSSII
jgi:hypothetical protein